MIGVDFVGDVKSVFVDMGVFANMPDGGENVKIFTEVFLDSMGFGRGLDDN